MHRLHRDWVALDKLGTVTPPLCIMFNGQRETFVDGYMSFFKSQQITESHGFINWIREEANIARNFVRQLNALITETEALEDQGDLFNTLMDLRDDREAVQTKLQGLNGLITQAEQEIEMKEAQVKSAAAKMACSKSVYQHTMGRGGYTHVKQKMIENKEIELDEEPPRGILW
ncbi:hypothetical protein Tco_0179756 [Tanacetum coccineum]